MSVRVRSSRTWRLPQAVPPPSGPCGPCLSLGGLWGELKGASHVPCSPAPAAPRPAGWGRTVPPWAAGAGWREARPTPQLPGRRTPLPGQHQGPSGQALGTSASRTVAADTVPRRRSGPPCPGRCSPRDPRPGHTCGGFRSSPGPDGPGEEQSHRPKPGTRTVLLVGDKLAAEKREKHSLGAQTGTAGRPATHTDTGRHHRLHDTRNS